jgi:hypothetical protein
MLNFIYPQGTLMHILRATLLLSLALVTSHWSPVTPLFAARHSFTLSPPSADEGSLALQDDDPPQLKRNEELALHRTKRILQSLGTYHKRYGELPRALAQLGPPQDEPPSKKAARLISWQLASGKSDGYRYAYKFRPAADERPEGYELKVRPEKYATTGRVAFYADDSGAIHSTREDREPTPDDPAIEQKQ